MKKILLIPIILVGFISTTNCNSSKSEKFNSSSKGFYKGRGSSIDALYYRALDEDDSLNDLDERINNALSYNNTQQGYNKINSKNNRIRVELQNLANNLKDSSLYNFANKLIQKHDKTFDKSSAQLKEKLKNQSLEKIELQNLYSVLKINEVIHLLDNEQKEELEEINTSKELISEKKLIQEVKNQL